MQRFTFVRDCVEQHVELPDPEAELLPGVRWGNPCVLFTPAYWYTQYLMSFSSNSEATVHRLGRTFAEEVTACLLGGHGISAEIGLAVFERLRSAGLIANLCTDQATLEGQLYKPVDVSGRSVRYRFWRQKANYLVGAYHALRAEEFPVDDATLLRDKLLALPGIGPKTASWIVRNWLGSNDVAILDIHLVRAGVLAELFSPKEDVNKQYRLMEKRFLTFCNALGAPASHLDALIWRTMRTTPRLVKRSLDRLSLDAS